MGYVFYFFILLFSHAYANHIEEDNVPLGHVSVQLSGQFGNQLFEIATAYAYSLDNNLALTIPDLVQKSKDNIPYNAKAIFLSKINSYDLQSSYIQWKQPSFNYTEIPVAQSIELEGYFQSDKYFKHRRSEILELFSPPQGMKERIFSKYPFLDSEVLVVGVQIRDYRLDKMYGKNHNTVRRSYYEAAMAKFPKDTIFLVSSNNPSYARKCTEGLAENIIYEDSSSYIESFYSLVFCKSFIISNSTFGWWAAWLSRDPNKVVFIPNPWFALPYNNDEMVKDLFPEDWIIIQNKKDSGIK